MEPVAIVASGGGRGSIGQFGRLLPSCGVSGPLLDSLIASHSLYAGTGIAASGAARVLSSFSARLRFTVITFRSTCTVTFDSPQ